MEGREGTAVTAELSGRKDPFAAAVGGGGLSYNTTPPPSTSSSGSGSKWYCSILIAVVEMVHAAA